ncbi:sulfotransferase family protein [Nitrospirillum pindoramense]|uniref:Sulfotransferase family protein n=1 Tax=Nitrospirillum amazonense TaxID=28077 RepID=A0A560H4E2_9PROT|nr:sulfotransferase [Nitrospirillum amazonense]TWB41176.1 sulfotransferase family protein [Nitrospirillum amazonense]
MLSNEHQMLFIGGSGRSGTSLLATCLLENREILGFPNLELKFITSKSGLIEIYRVITACYAPDRANGFLEDFEALYKAICFTDAYGQIPLNRYVGHAHLMDGLNLFKNKMQHHGQVAPMACSEVAVACRELINHIYKYADLPEKKGDLQFYCLEKTPHCLLHVRFLSEVFPGSKFIHVMRDPRAVVCSLSRMPWAPRTLDARINWVKNYVKAYQTERAAFTRAGGEILQLKHEKIVKRSKLYSRKILEFLKIESDLDFISMNADLGRLSAWYDGISSDERKYLDDNLRHECKYFSYDT